MSNGSFARELSDSRTFCRKADVDAMRENGLAQGGTLDNAVVVDGETVLTPGGLRHQNEAVRHKMLDAFGDLYLAGGRSWAGMWANVPATPPPTSCCASCLKHRGRCARSCARPNRLPACRGRGLSWTKSRKSPDRNIVGRQLHLRADKTFCTGILCARPKPNPGLPQETIRLGWAVWLAAKRQSGLRVHFFWQPL